MCLFLSKQFKSLFILLVVFLLNAPLSAGATSPDATSRCFIQNAKSGSCKRLKGTSDQYKIKFKGVAPNILFFSNKPTAHAQFIEIEKFVAAWNTNKAAGFFANNPANAFLALSVDGFKDVCAFNVENLSYDKKKKQITYIVKLISITKWPQTTFKAKKHKKPPKKFKDSSFFIDNPSDFLFGNSWDSLGG